MLSVIMSRLFYITTLRFYLSRISSYRLFFFNYIFYKMKELTLKEHAVVFGRKKQLNIKILT
jgi:hypothetical protein